jgi:hypothetical protein
VSDNFLLFVPVDPWWQPTQADADRAVALFKTIAPDAHDISASFSDDVEFHHPFANWDGVRCPACAADLEDWFYASVEKAFEKDIRPDLPVTTPCCGLSTSLNDLDFVEPAAFGRFVLEAMNPGVITDADQDRSIAACLGTDLRKIWRHL